MIVKKNSEKEIVRGIFKALVARKKMAPAICSIVKEFDGPLHDLKSYYEGRMYKHLCYKFRPWICLQQLDLSATVSFRAYNAVSKIEYCEEPNGAKYIRGLLYSWHKLSKLCQQLEAYAKAENFLSYVLTSSSIKFDLHTGINFLMEKHGLWQQVLHGQQVKMAATVDRVGELAWKLTQISAGIKLIDPHTINPLTGELLFGDSRHFKVQSRNVCYPCMCILQRITNSFILITWSHFLMRLIV